jgi:hypothetical protein
MAPELPTPWNPLYRLFASINLTGTFLLSHGVTLTVEKVIATVQPHLIVPFHVHQLQVLVSVAPDLITVDWGPTYVGPEDDLFVPVYFKTSDQWKWGLVGFPAHPVDLKHRYAY